MSFARGGPGRVPLSLAKIEQVLTGGPQADPALHPNAGLFRARSRTLLVFVSNDGDCSHDGTLDEHSACGVAECTFAENEPDSPLLDVANLKRDLLANLSQTRGHEVDDASVTVVSIHGRPQRYTEPRPEPTCPQGFELPISCRLPSRVAYSGHRYDAFIRQFPIHFPRAASPDTPFHGAICSHFDTMWESL